MSKPKPENRVGIATSLAELLIGINQLAAEQGETDLRRLIVKDDHFFPGHLLIPDADDEETFLKNAAKDWRRCHPVKLGRPSVECLIFKECFDLYQSKKISENTSLEKISNAIMDNPEGWEGKYRQKVPYQSTVLKHVRVWREMLRKMLSKGKTLEDMRKKLLDIAPGRPYLAPWRSLGKKSRK